MFCIVLLPLSYGCFRNFPTYFITNNDVNGKLIMKITRSYRSGTGCILSIKKSGLTAGCYTERLKIFV